MSKLYWLHDKQIITTNNVQNITTDITIYTMDISRQYIKGHITGVNSSRWKQHGIVDTRFILSISTLLFLFFSIG